MTCPAPTVTSASALSATQVVVSFDRKLDAASVDAGDFVFDNGLAASAVSVAGNIVTVTTSAQSPGTTYTVTVANVSDVLGSAVGSPNSAMFASYVPVAQLLFNELNPNIVSSRDLIELFVASAGSVDGVQLLQVGSVTDILATLPDVTVAMGDLIVVHLNPVGAAGAAPGSETSSKSEYATAAYSANYDTAWDFQGGTTGLTFSDRVLRIETPAAVVLDAVPVVLSSSASPPAVFPTTLQALQAAGLWLPIDCGGVPCTYVSTPTAVEISVDYLGVGTTATGNSIARKLGVHNRQSSDWNVAAAPTFGQPNP
jgi:hypothetical protein